jgi:hypothetical protein
MRFKTMHLKVLQEQMGLQPQLAFNQPVLSQPLLEAARLTSLFQAYKPLAQRQQSLQQVLYLLLQLLLAQVQQVQRQQSLLEYPLLQQHQALKQPALLRRLQRQAAYQQPQR